MNLMIRRNKEWEKQPKKIKELFYESLPIPMPIILVVIIAINVLPLFIAQHFFPGMESYFVILIQMLLSVIVVLCILFGMARHYKKKTGKNIFEELRKAGAR